MNLQAGCIRITKLLKYTAVLTTFNSEKSILRALNSILEQEFPPSELIIVDDCSTDTTFLIASKILNLPFNFQIFQNPTNMGVAYSRNFAARHALQSYLIFFDDDDVSHKMRARVHLKHFELGAVVSYVSSSKNYLNGYSVRNISNEFVGQFETGGFIGRQLLGVGEFNYFTPASCMAINRDIFLSLNGFDTELRRLEDSDLAIRLSSVKSQFAFSSEICVDRYDFGKTASIFEGISQKAILIKHRSSLSTIEYREASFKIEIRDLYFGRKIGKLIYRVLKEVIVHPSQLKYLLVGIRRIRHDLAKR